MALTFRTKNLEMVDKAVAILTEERPMTLRQLFYRLISAGILENSQNEYKRLGKAMTRLREAGDVPRTWIVDHIRDTLKPSSWSGLADYGDSVRECYRKDFWASLDHHVEIFVEKDAIAGTIQPVTTEYDVALHVCRGYVSISFAGEIADDWQHIAKPIYAYYIGDYDPSGFDLERDLREKLERYSGRQCAMNSSNCPEPELVFYWSRLALQESDFEDHNLIALPVKKGDRRAKAFIENLGDQCAEVDALPPTELRDRVKSAIESHIDLHRWVQLEMVEKAEKATLLRTMNRWRKVI